MDGVVRSYSDLERDAPPELRGTMSELRSYCMSLASAVEHVRAHRVVFGRSAAMRWFADVSAGDGAVELRVNMGFRRGTQSMRVARGADLAGAKRAIAEAHASV